MNDEAKSLIGEQKSITREGLRMNDQAKSMIAEQKSITHGGLHLQR